MRDLLPFIAFFFLVAVFAFGGAAEDYFDKAQRNRFVLDSIAAAHPCGAAVSP